MVVLTCNDACDDGDGQGGSDGDNSNVGDAVSVMKGDNGVVGEVVIGEIVVSHIMEQKQR